ncbi:hypothetical protein BDV33DRAFT_164788 [Aspergillus novoparasiticus]|uniref:Uncharacterized protein n=1 Tax=Aspergillus novoparasiticus TaxID=986946 RepID=A0A5N6F702_9EURO|nr:hypothetical protein BDV33DRAFT_164788 [Aspergillus novoparasiticus]
MCMCMCVFMSSSCLLLIYIFVLCLWLFVQLWYLVLLSVISRNITEVSFYGNIRHAHLIDSWVRNYESSPKTQTRNR